MSAIGRAGLAPLLSGILAASHATLAFAQIAPMPRQPVPIPGAPPATVVPPAAPAGPPPIGPNPTLAELIRLHGFQIVAVTQPADTMPVVFVQKANAAWFCRLVKDGVFSPRLAAEFGGYRCTEIR